MYYYTIYKPNSKNTGACCSFKIVELYSQEKNKYSCCLFVECLKQKSWDASKRLGTFDTEKANKIILKFNIEEAGNIINFLNTNGEFKGIHATEEHKTQFSFTTWKREGSDTINYALGVKTDGKSISVPITVGESIALKILLENFILKSFETATKNA